METPPTLRLGAQNASVLVLKTKLKQLGFLKVGVPNDIFDDQTRLAVIGFQRFAALVPDGIVGPKSWVALFGKTMYEQRVEAPHALTKTPTWAWGATFLSAYLMYKIIFPKR